MWFWIRELLGWTLIAAGIFAFWWALRIVLDEGPLLLEASYFLIVGFVIFRGGLQILKISMAGRICLQTQNQAASFESQSSTPIWRGPRSGEAVANLNRPRSRG
jgi:hypothetical protein